MHLVEGQAVWGLAQVPLLSTWCRQRGATPEDDLVFSVLDVEVRRYAVDLVRRSERDEPERAAAIATRNCALADAAESVVRPARNGVAHFDLIPRLIGHDAYRDPLPPDPWADVLRADLRFVLEGLHVFLAEKLVDEAESEVDVPPDVSGPRRPDGKRREARSAEARLKWGDYLFGMGLECLWAGWRAEAEAYFKEALRLDPGHADAAVHVGNRRLEEGRPAEALPWFERAQVAAEERTIGDADRYPGPFWIDLDSRPYMRALHGRGLCLWRLGHDDDARQVFARMLELNPNDNQGARFLLRDLDDGLSWEESEERDRERFE